MKRQQSSRGSSTSSPAPDGSAVPRPYVLNWKPNSVQKKFLEDHERRLKRQGKSQAEAKRKRLELSASSERDATLGTPWEQEIRKAIYADHRAFRHLRFFIYGDGAEWAMMIRLSMWARAGDQHPSMTETNREFLVPRDQVLSFLRGRGHTGATHSELVKIWPNYATWFTELRRRGFKFESTRVKALVGGDDFHYVVKEEPRRYQLTTMSDEFTRIARAIESLGRPTRLRDAWGYADMMARSKRFLKRSMEENPLNYRWKGLVEDDIIRVAGNHLKRMTYLMAVAQKTVWKSAKSTDDLSKVLFQRLHKRIQRHAAKSKTN
jgi:hypothetical protein